MTGRTTSELVWAADACVQQVDAGEGPPPTLAEAVELVAHFFGGLKPADLHIAVAYLACQVVGLRQSRDADASLAMQQIARVVADYARKKPYTLRTGEVEPVGQLGASV